MLLYKILHDPFEFLIGEIGFIAYKLWDYLAYNEQEPVEEDIEYFGEELEFGVDLEVGVLLTEKGQGLGVGLINDLGTRVVVVE